MSMASRILSAGSSQNSAARSTVQGGHVLEEQVPRGAVGLAVDLAALAVGGGERRLGVRHDVAGLVEPLEGLRPTYAGSVLPVARPVDQLVVGLIPGRVQLHVAALAHHRLAQLVAGALLIDEERGVGVEAGEVGGALVRVHDLVDEGQHERHVRARANGQPQVSLGCGAGEARVDADHLRAALLRALDGQPVVVAAAALLAAPDDDAVGVVAVPAGVLGLVAVEALAGEVAAHPAQVAHAEGSGGSQLKPQLVDGLELQHVAAGAVLVGDGVPAVLLADLGELLGGLLVGLLPGDALPLARALLAHAALGVAHAGGVVQLLRDGEGAPAQGAFAEQVGVALDLGQAAVLDGAEQRAAAIALATRAGDDLDVIGALVGRRFVGEGRLGGSQQHGRRRGHGRRLDEVATAQLQRHSSLLL